MTEVIEGEAIRVESGWKGDFPFFLVIEPIDQTHGNTGIDLDEGGWIERNKELMRAPGTWWLYHKETGRPFFCLLVAEGDQPYFTKRHVGNLMAGMEVVAIGIGKKAANGDMTRLWLLPNGVVCGGDDVEDIAARMIGG